MEAKEIGEQRNRAHKNEGGEMEKDRKEDSKGAGDRRNFDDKDSEDSDSEQLSSSLTPTRVPWTRSSERISDESFIHDASLADVNTSSDTHANAQDEAQEETTVDMDYWKALVDQEMDLSGVKIGRQDIRLLAAFVCPQETGEDEPAIATLRVPSTGDMKRQQVYTLDSSDESLDLSSRNLGPEDAQLLSAWVRRRPVRSVLACLSISNLDFGQIYQPNAQLFQVQKKPCVWYRNSQKLDDTNKHRVLTGRLVVAIHETEEWVQVADCRWLPKSSLTPVDTSQPCPWEVFCAAIRSSNLRELDLSRCSLSGPHLSSLALSLFDPTSNTCNLHMMKITIDSAHTWDIKKQSTYTLDTNDSALDLSSKNLGEEDIALVSAWIQLPQSKGLRVLNVLKNPIGEAGLSTLVDAVRGLPIGSICGLTEGQKSVDLSAVLAVND